MPCDAGQYGKWDIYFLNPKKVKGNVLEKSGRGTLTGGKLPDGRADTATPRKKPRHTDLVAGL
jgi:hypothetical protein